MTTSRNQAEEFGYVALRVGVAILFFFHAPQKCYGWWNSPAFPLLSLRGLAIIIETVISPLIAGGLFTLYPAVLGAAEMVARFGSSTGPSARYPLGAAASWRSCTFSYSYSWFVAGWAIQPRLPVRVENMKLQSSRVAWSWDKCGDRGLP
jgi:hypothetical protein